MYFDNCMSQVWVLGKRKAFLPTLPKVPKMGRLIAPVGAARVQVGTVGGQSFVGSNASGLSQLTQLTVTPAHGPGRYGLIFWHGSLGPPLPVQNVPRSLPIPVPESSVPCNTPMGRPVAADTIPANV